jgi:hypothetical protein
VVVAAIEPGLLGADGVQGLFGVMAFERKELLFGSCGDKEFVVAFVESSEALFFEYAQDRIVNFLATHF